MTDKVGYNVKIVERSWKLPSALTRYNIMYCFSASHYGERPYCFYIVTSSKSPLAKPNRLMGLGPRHS